MGEGTNSRRVTDLADVFQEINRLKKNIDRGYFGNMTEWQIGKFHNEITRLEVRLEEFRDDSTKAIRQIAAANDVVLNEREEVEATQAESPPPFVNTVKPGEMVEVLLAGEKVVVPKDSILSYKDSLPYRTLDETQEANRAHCKHGEEQTDEPSETSS